MSDLGEEMGGVLAESVMKRVVQKEDFNAMQILGQFNLGFIITKIDNHLFIVDQHATDEKYRFETLQASTTIKQQPLFIPMRLATSAANEVTIMAHLVFSCVFPLLSALVFLSSVSAGILP